MTIRASTVCPWWRSLFGRGAAAVRNGSAGPRVEARSGPPCAGGENAPSPQVS